MSRGEKRLMLYTGSPIFLELKKKIKINKNLRWKSFLLMSPHPSPFLEWHVLCLWCFWYCELKILWTAAYSFPCLRESSWKKQWKHQNTTFLLLLFSFFCVHKKFNGKISCRCDVSLPFSIYVFPFFLCLVFVYVPLVCGWCWPKYPMSPPTHPPFFVFLFSEFS